MFPDNPLFVTTVGGGLEKRTSIVTSEIFHVKHRGIFPSKLERNQEKVAIVNKALNALKRPLDNVLAVAIIGIILLTSLSSCLAIQKEGSILAPFPKATPKRSTATPSITPTANITPTPSLIVLPSQEPSNILGVEGSPGTNYVGIAWVRLGHPSCGHGNLSGQVLRDTMQSYHQKGVWVLITICQNNSGNLNNADIFNDVAQSQPDAVQCGNEEMKQDAAVSFLYTPPDKFAQFYDLCEHAIHAVGQSIPVVLGSLDPHVAGADYQLMLNQVSYLNNMQYAMNTSVHPGGNWDWHTQILGVIDSWHSGYQSANNLAGVFNFWAQQFQIDPNSGQLGKHLWVVEGTSCFKGCGLDGDTQVAISHILTLITDVQTAMQDQIPFFFFSGKDFIDANFYWPIGVLDADGHPKPLRQDLAMGARTLTLSCPDGSSPVIAEQEPLLAKLYSHCTLPANYVAILAS